MFDPTLEELITEIDEGEKLRDQCLGGVNRIIREYTGRWYRYGKDHTAWREDSENNPEPFGYSFVSNILPALIYENPSCVVQARRIIGHKVFSEAMQSGIRSWMIDVDYKKELERVVLDFLFFQGILMHYIEDDTRWSNGAVRPNCKRIDYRHFGGDAPAPSVEMAEMLFHDYMVDLDELAEDPAVDQDALSKLKPNMPSERSPKEDPFYTQGYENLKRRQVKLHSVWLRRKNVIRVVCRDPRVELYPPRPYYGPDTGPYSVFRAYPVPGQFYPLSPLVAVQDQVQDLQVHARAAARSAAGRKSLIIVDSSLGTLAEDVKNAEDREVIGIPGFNSAQAQQIELGGTTPGQYEYLDMLRNRLDTHAGLTETTRGQVSGSTATESQIADEALNNRTEYLKSRVREATQQSLHAIGWFLFHTPGVIIPVNRRDPTTGMESEGLFFGGQFPGEDSGAWSDYAVKIEPLSMQRVSEQVLQRRAMDLAGFIAEIGPLMVQMPWIRWVEILRMVGEALNQDNVEQFVIPELIGAMSQPDLIPPSAVMGPDGGPGERYSVPGQGFKARPMESGLSNASPAIDERRSEMSKPFGDEFGGTQGPPKRF